MNTLTALFAAMGLDTTSPKSIKAQLLAPEFKMAVRKIATQTTVLKRLAMVTQLVQAATKQNLPSGVTESVADEEWIIGSFESNGVMLKSGEMTIKMNRDEAEKLKGAIERKQEVSVVSKNSKRYVFTPAKKHYKVSQMGYDTSITMNHKQVEQLLDLIGDEE
jgi:hypothetical protein